MAQTPISASAKIITSTPTTLYTVPSGSTAIVKSVIGTSVIGGSDLTLNKVSGGTIYPVTNDYPTSVSQGTGSTPSASSNLLPAPITLTAGESISVSSSTVPAYKFDSIYSSTNNITNVYYFNSTWIAIGVNTITGYGAILTSTDGTTWTQQTFNNTTTLKGLAYDGSSNYVVVGSTYGEVFTSTNLTSWTRVTIPLVTGLNAVAYNGTHWITVANGGAYASATTPGGTWTAYYLPQSLTNNITSISWMNSTWVFGVSSATIATSTNSDGSSAIFAYSVAGQTGPTFTTIGVASSSNYKTYSITGGSYTSSDSISWTKNAQPFSDATFNSFARPGSNYSVLYKSAASTNFYYSSDGVSWSGLYNSSATIKNWLCNPTQGYMVCIAVNQTQGQSFSTPGDKSTSAWNVSANLKVITWQPYTHSNYNLMFYTELTAGANFGKIGSHYYNYSSRSVTDSGLSALTAATVGTPYISFYNGTSWFVVTNTFKILNKSSFSTTTITDTGKSTPNVTFSAIAANGNTYVAAVGTTLYTTTDAGISWTTRTLPQAISSTDHTQTLIWNAYLSRFMLLLPNGTIAQSSDGLTWTFPIYSLANAATVNSQNLLVTTGGALYSTTNPVSNSTLITTISGLTSGVGYNNILYAGGTYYFANSTKFTTSTNLISFSENAVNSSQVNNSTYVAPFSAATDGTNFLLGGGLEQNFAFETVFTATLENAVVTAGIVEIS